MDELDERLITLLRHDARRSISDLAMDLGVSRATVRARILRAAGLTNVHILEGGITAWEAQGFDVVRGRQRWDLERQVRLVAGAIVLFSVLASVVVPGLQWVAAAIGGGLMFAALTNTCAMGMLLAKLPYNRGATCDARTIVAQLIDSGPETGRS